MGAKLCAKEEESIGDFMDPRDSPRYIHGGASRGALNESSEYHAHWKICALITYSSSYFKSRITIFFPD